MPLYDYKCHGCGKKFEVRQSFSDPLLTTHDECGGKVERLISTPAFQFKGSGFYITDYAKGGNSSPASAENGSAKPAETKSESTPAASSNSSSSPSTPAPAKE